MAHRKKITNWCRRVRTKVRRGSVPAERLKEAVKNWRGACLRFRYVYRKVKQEYYTSLHMQCGADPVGRAAALQLVVTDDVASAWAGAEGAEPPPT